MSALNFVKRFARAVEGGHKRQTIRRLRRDGRRPCKVGGALQLYTGMRTAQCRKLADATCTSIQVVTIEPHRMTVDGETLSPEQRSAIAIADGFTTYGDLVAWVGEYREPGEEPYPFTGHLITWELGA